MANGRCRMHGGKSLVGPMHPNWKGGRYSKYLPTKLAQRYEAAAADPELTSLRDELAVVDSRTVELLEAIGETGSLKLWRQAHEKFRSFQSAGGKKEAIAAARTALAGLEDVLQQGLDVAATWDELRENLELRRRLAESETRRMKDLHQMVTVERVIALMNQLGDAVKRHVDDPAVLTALSAEFVRISRGGVGPPVEA